MDLDADHRTKKYSAPALDKGLDILELLATKTEPMTKSQIAQELGRSTSEVFRMLGCLEDRGYISARTPGDGYRLTMRLHRLANNWPPTRRLIDAALPEMRSLAEETLQSCHLGLYNAGKLYVAAQAESPLPVTLSFKISAEFPLLRTASGRVLLAFQDRRVADHWIAASEPDLDRDGVHALTERLERIRSDGYELSESDRIDGLTDISCPIVDAQGSAVAAITIPFMTFLNRDARVEDVRRRLIVAARDISAAL